MKRFILLQKIVVGKIELEEVQLQRERENNQRIPMDHMRYVKKILRSNADELWEINVFDTFDLRSLFNLPSLSQEEIRRAIGLEPMWDVFEDDFKAAVGEIVPNFAQEKDDEDEGEEEEEKNVNLM
ncbi:hypothetical protein PUN28_020809 [Cardiocondyla obscurior]|uniref:Uncharacterized protein n=1 Tax=Cardiocondyla obscurior TaxID=286306 RepID=A0AAW2E943_9HYME